RRGRVRSPSSLILRLHVSALSPLSFKELDYGLLKCRLVRRRVVVTFTLGSARRWHCFEKPRDLLVGGVRLPVNYQYRYIDALEVFGGQGLHDVATNNGRQHLRISSRDSSCYEIGRGEVSGNNLSLLQDSCSLLRPHPSGNRTGYRIWDRPTLRKLQNVVLHEVVPNPSENDRFHLGRAQHEQPGACARSHRNADHVNGVKAQVFNE